MKFTFLLFFLCLLNTGYSQVDNPKSNLSIELNYSPNFNNRILTYEPSWRWFIDSRELHEKPSYGYNIGVSVKYKMKNRFKLDFGIQLAREGMQFIDVPISTDFGSEPGLATSKYKYYYIEFPLRVNYELISGSFVVNGIFGFSPKYFIHSRNVNNITYTNGQKDKTVGKNILMNPNKINVNALLGIGTYFKINDRLQFNIEPIFRISLAPLDKSSNIKQYNYSFGLHLGVELKL